MSVSPGPWRVSRTQLSSCSLSNAISKAASSDRRHLSTSFRRLSEVSEVLVSAVVLLSNVADDPELSVSALDRGEVTGGEVTGGVVAGGVRGESAAGENSKLSSRLRRGSGGGRDGKGIPTKLALAVPAELLALDSGGGGTAEAEVSRSVVSSGVMVCTFLLLLTIAPMAARELQ